MSALRGTAAALAAAVFVGTANVAAKLALDLGAHPLRAVAVGYAIAALPFAAFVPRLRLEGAGEWLRLAGLTLAGGVLAPIAILYGLRLTTATVASLLINLELLFTTLLALAFLGERVRAREAWVLALIAAGGLLVSVGPALAEDGAPDVGALAGAGLVALATLGFSVDSILSTPLARRHALPPLLGAKVCGGALALASVSWMVTGGVGVPAAALGPLAYVGLLGVSGAIGAFYVGLRHVGATRTVVLFSTAALWGAVTATLALGERLTWAHLAGGVMMLGGVLLLVKLHGAPAGTAPVVP